MNKSDVFFFNFSLGKRNLSLVKEFWLHDEVKYIF